VSDRIGRLRPAPGGWAEAWAAWLESRSTTWLLLIPSLGALVGAAMAAGLGASWHEALAWALVGMLVFMVPSAYAALNAARAHSLITDAHSLADLRALSYHEFEEQVAEVFRRKGCVAALTQREADGGADIILRRSGERQLVQCKQARWSIPVKEVRAFYGVLAAEKVRHGYFVTTSDFTPEAVRFGGSVGMELIRGRRLLRNLEALRDSPEV
jgi:restriction system protein